MEKKSMPLFNEYRHKCHIDHYPMAAQDAFYDPDVFHPALVRLFKSLVGQASFQVSQCSKDTAPYRLRTSIGHPSMAIHTYLYVKSGQVQHENIHYLRFACLVFEQAARLGVRVHWGGNDDVSRDVTRWELMIKHE